MFLFLTFFFEVSALFVATVETIQNNIQSELFISDLEANTIESTKIESINVEDDVNLTFIYATRNF